MNHTESCFLHFLSCGLRGTPATDAAGLTDMEWQEIFELSRIHHVLPIIFEAVHGLPELKNAEYLPVIRQQVRKLVFLQTQKSAETLRLLDMLAQAGVRPLVVKGMICRNLYPKPDHRYSSDEDLLISPQEFSRCQEVFAGFGLVTELTPQQQADTYEIPYRQKDGSLYIELHRHLFPPESESYGYLERYFPDVHSRAALHEIDGTSVYSLDYTDHLFYLICHALKHFLHSGFGIRQVCDILMYARSYTGQINWPRLLNNCRQIHALSFTAALFRIGRRHLGFGADICPPQLLDAGIDEMPMLEDLLQAGIYGSSSESRLHSSNITLEAVASSRQKRSAQNPVLVSLFPPAQKLEGRYPWLKEHPWLLPAAWANRIGVYCRDSLRQRPSGAADALSIGRERVDLLKFYGLLDSRNS